MPRAVKYNIEVHVALHRGGLFQNDICEILNLPKSFVSRAMSVELPNDIQNKLIQLITDVATNQKPTKQNVADMETVRNYFLDTNGSIQTSIDDRTIKFVERLLLEKNEFDAYNAEFNDLCEKFD